jgi:hypothetical protein
VLLMKRRHDRTKGRARAAQGDADGLQVEAWTASVVSKGDSVLMLPLPIFHVYANVGVQALAFVTGNPIALVPNPRDLKDLLNTIKREKPVFLTGVPTLFVGILNHPDVQAGKVDFSSIKICFRAAALLAKPARRPGDHRRAHRRGLLADRGDDGPVREPGGSGPKLAPPACAAPASRAHLRRRGDARSGRQVGEICFGGAQRWSALNRPEPPRAARPLRRG